MRYAGSILAAAVLALGCSTVSADVYKWVDDKGVVNYSNSEPPASVGATRLNENNPHVSFYKAVPPTPEQLAQLDRYTRFREQMQMIEQASYGAGVPVADPYPGWYQQCKMEMWADCDDPRALSTRYDNPLWGFPRVIGAGPRFGTVPFPPPFARPRIPESGPHHHM